MLELIYFFFVTVFGCITVESTSTITVVRFIYNQDVTLECSSAESSLFYQTTKAGVTKKITTEADVEKYVLNGNRLTLKNLSKMLPN